MDSVDLKIGERFQEETKYFRPSAVSARPDQEPVSFASRSIPLPPPEISGGPGIWEVLRKRRSTRDYRKEPLNLKELANLLWATQGVTVKAPAPWFRTAPSAGALHPIDTYLIVNQTKGLASGIYRLKVEEFTLESKKIGDFSSRIAQAALDQDIAREAAVVFVWVAVIQRSRQKYRQRAYRYIYLDSGHLAQNLYLAATAMDLGCCAIAAFFDEEVNQIVGVDGTEETTVYLATIGKKGRSRESI
jgi:SagB-type dehydrogenase family enzyme